MRKLVLIILGSLFLFSSCIEIVEEIDIQKDLSGTFSFYIDLGALDKLDNKMTGQYLPGDIITTIHEQPAIAYDKLVKVKGISNIKSITSGGKYGVSFHFKNPSALNKALYALIDKKKTFFSPKLIKISKHKLLHRDIAPWMRLYLADKAKDQKNQMVLQFVTLSQNFSFPSEIRSSDNPRSKQGKTGNTVSSSYTLLEILTTDISVKEKIRYK